MKVTIGRRIWLGFGSLILLMLIVLYLTNNSVALSKRIHADINNVYDPSVKKLNELSFKLEQSKILINYWAYVECKADAQEKQKFLSIVGKDIPRIQAEIDTLSSSWNPSDQSLKKVIYQDLEDLKELYLQVQIWLPDFESYQAASGLNWFMARDLAEEEGIIYEQVHTIDTDLRNLIRIQENYREEALDDMVDSFETLQFYSTYIGGFLILIGIIIGLLTARSIVNPVHRLKSKLTTMGRGVLPNKENRITQDELGEMSSALNNLIDGQERIRTFVNALGSGDFTVDYEPLSEEDELAPDFIRTRDALAESERITEMKIAQRTKQLEEKNKQINEQSKKVIALYQDLRDSIEYAKRLQDSILPAEEKMKNLLPNSFVYYQPKDIVSGDFYWVDERDDKVYIAAVDCTGHGVPGAFMSLIGHNSLNRAMELANLDDPGDILGKLNVFATDALNRNIGDTTVRDGMDAALCIWDKRKKTLRFAGAMRPLVYFKNGEMNRIRGDRVAIGGIDHKNHPFTSHSIELSQGDAFYVFSDGYPDQFGGDSPQGKKYKIARFLDSLEGAQSLDMEEQLSLLRVNMTNWQGRHPQVDDILIMGAKI